MHVFHCSRRSVEISTVLNTSMVSPACTWQIRLQHHLHCNLQAALLALPTFNFHEQVSCSAASDVYGRGGLIEFPLHQIASAVCDLAASLIAAALNQPKPRSDQPCAGQSAYQSCFSRLQQACHICMCTMHLTYFREDASIWRLIPSANHLHCIDLPGLSASWSTT